MKRLLLLAALAAGISVESLAEQVTLQETTYEVERKIDREIGPGIRHTRFRLPKYPLNINVVTVDLNNPYNRIETTVANETAKGTELLVKAAERQSSPGHRAVAGANANFWVVASQPEEKTYTGTTRNASVRNGKMVTESNQHRDQWDGGTMRTGVVAMSYDKTAYIDYCTSSITVTSDKIGSLMVHQCNKGVWSDELCMYNSFYGKNTRFMPITQDNAGKYQHDNGGDATEVILDLVEGQGWDSGRDIHFTVAEVRLNEGKGTLGDHDLALVGRGDNAAKIAALAPGDAVTLKYSWTYNPGTENEVTPLVEQAVGGNALIMRNGELTEHNFNETYNSQIYSRTGYGCSADGKTLYIVVIDKAADPVYGSSKGCNTATMCEFARWLGCSNMGNFDAGGSAEMFINGKIENKTTESAPRPVANGWLIYSTAPEDTEDSRTVASLAFDDMVLQAPIYGQYVPSVIAYNKYGAVIDYNFKDFTLTCDEALGTCEGNVFKASGTAGTGSITATCGDASVSGTIEVKNAEIALRIKNLLIDTYRTYPVEVSAIMSSGEYTYDPRDIEWNVEDPSIVTIDENGVLKAHKEGTTSYTAKIGDFVDRAEVTVEIAPEAVCNLSSNEMWTAKGSSGITNAKYAADGTVTFTYGAPRDPYVNLNGPAVLYSLPDAIYVEFTPAVDMRSVSFDVRTPVHPKTNILTVTPEDGKETFAAGSTYTVAVPLDRIGAPEDMAVYPISINFIRFSIAIDSAYKGDQSLRVNRIWAEYKNSGGIESVSPQASTVYVSPNPVEASGSFTVSGDAIERISVYNAAGMAVSTVKAEGVSQLTLQAPSVAGAYVVHTLSASGYSSSILIVK